MTDTHTTKKVEAKNPRSRASNKLAIAGEMPNHMELMPMGRNASTDSDSVGNPYSSVAASLVANGATGPYFGQ